MISKLFVVYVVESLFVYNTFISLFLLFIMLFSSFQRVFSFSFFFCVFVFSLFSCCFCYESVSYHFAGFINVTSPLSLQGSIAYAPSAYSDSILNPIASHLVIPNSNDKYLCDQPTTNLTRDGNQFKGKILLVQRGNCPFGNKKKNTGKTKNQWIGVNAMYWLFEDFVSMVSIFC